MAWAFNIVAIVVCGTASVFGAGGADAIERLLNSRSGGAPATYSRAAEEVAADAEKGKLLQRFVIALVSRDSDAPPAARLKDSVRESYLADGRRAITRLANERNNPLAWYLLSLDAGDTNLLRRAADGGNVQALNAWGNLLVNIAANDASTAENARKLFANAFECFNRAAARGDANALYNLGTCKWRGIGVKRNDAEAFECFRAAAMKGHPEAINNIGAFFREGNVVEKDLDMATRWFAKSASYGNAFGLYNYALALRRGEGTTRDPEKAAECLRKAVAVGNCIEACNTLALVLLSGDGVKADPEEAVLLLRQAADAGYPPAMENLSMCYSRGSGVKADEQLALEWKVRARAASGDVSAREWLEKNVKK